MVAALACVVDYCPNVGSSAPPSYSVTASNWDEKENGNGKNEKKSQLEINRV